MLPSFVVQVLVAYLMRLVIAMSRELVNLVLLFICAALGHFCQLWIWLWEVAFVGMTSGFLSFIVANRICGVLRRKAIK